MADLEEWLNGEVKRFKEDFSSHDRLGRGEKISLLDFAPEYEEILRERKYGLWLPSGARYMYIDKKLSFSNSKFFEDF